MRALLIALSALVLAPATAAAGGFATVGLSSPPASVGPGDTWVAEMEVLQHGVTPMENAAPTLVVEGGGSFLGKATGKPGVYRAEVTFPAAGEYRYVVRDIFGVEHGFPPVRIGDTAAAADGGGPSAWAALVIVAVAALLFAALGTLVLRRSAAPA